jgi:hypothetical protein
MVRKIAGAGPRQLKSLREAHAIEACLQIITQAPLDSAIASSVVRFLREIAEWDDGCRCVWHHAV